MLSAGKPSEFVIDKLSKKEKAHEIGQSQLSRNSNAAAKEFLFVDDSFQKSKKYEILSESEDDCEFERQLSCNTAGQSTKAKKVVISKNSINFIKA